MREKNEVAGTKNPICQFHPEFVSSWSPALITEGS